MEGWAIPPLCLSVGHNGRVRPLLVTLLLLLATACSSGSGGDSAQGHVDVTLPVGQGIHASAVGYTLEDLKLPAKAGAPARYSFRIGTWQHRTLTKFKIDQTKKMHVYLVRSDLAVFRHIHPRMSAQGVWSGLVTVPTPGRYRLVAEFIADDGGGNGDHLVLGESRVIGHTVKAKPFGKVTGRGTSDGITVRMLSKLVTGSQDGVHLGVSYDGTPADLGTYLGVYGHVTGIERRSGVVEHVHPLGAPDKKGKWAVLRLHTEFEKPGDYRLFVQVRLSGIVHTVPLNVHVARAATGSRA